MSNGNPVPPASNQYVSQPIMEWLRERVDKSLAGMKFGETVQLIEQLTRERDKLLAAIGEHITVRSEQYAQIQRLRAALEDAADMLHECQLECLDCNYGHGATGKDSEGDPCEECSPTREALRELVSIIAAEERPEKASVGDPTPSGDCPGERDAYLAGGSDLRSANPAFIASRQPCPICGRLDPHTHS